MKKITCLIILLFLLCISSTSNAQGIPINNTGTAADASALLDISSTSKGILIPRMDSVHRVAISSPAKGLLVFQTDGTAGLYCNYGIPATPNWQLMGAVNAGANSGDMTYWNGTSWVQVPAGTSGQTLTFCSGKPTWTTGGVCPLHVGDLYQGGIIFYIDNTGQHGLIAATSDQGFAPWNNGSSTLTNVSSTSNGAANTTAIITAQGSGSYAAALAHNYLGGGYTDWYLPSSDELTLLNQQSGVVGGFTGSNYWSSTEYSFNPTFNAVGLNIVGSGSPLSLSKFAFGYVRAIRAF